MLHFLRAFDYCYSSIFKVSLANYFVATKGLQCIYAYLVDTAIAVYWLSISTVDRISK